MSAFDDGDDPSDLAVFRARVIWLVRHIPPGRVATYGQVAALAGRPRGARACGRVLRDLVGGNNVPWQRVINAQGRISSGGDVHRPMFQRTLLEAEGVVFRRSGRCDLERFRWAGPDDAGNDHDDA